jgi:hypothetical protein
MNHHRIPELKEPYRLPSATASITPGAFIACPLVLLQSMPVAQQCWQSSLYQLAFEQAQAALRPSLPERDLLAVWN